MNDYLFTCLIYSDQMIKWFIHIETGPKRGKELLSEPIPDKETDQVLFTVWILTKYRLLFLPINAQS